MTVDRHNTLSRSAAAGCRTPSKSPCVRVGSVQIYIYIRRQPLGVSDPRSENEGQLRRVPKRPRPWGSLHSAVFGDRACPPLLTGQVVSSSHEIPSRSPWWRSVSV
jgi:hypothetical protein